MSSTGCEHLTDDGIQRTAVYRHYAEDGALLYVGISGNPARRLLEHEVGSGFFGSLHRTEYQWFDCRMDALKCEAQAIEEEQPKFNKIGGFKRFRSSGTPRGFLSFGICVPRLALIARKARSTGNPPRQPPLPHRRRRNDKCCTRGCRV